MDMGEHLSVKCQLMVSTDMVCLFMLSVLELLFEDIMGPDSIGKLCSTNIASIN